MKEDTGFKHNPKYRVVTDIPGTKGNFWDTHTWYCEAFQLTFRLEQALSDEWIRRVEDIFTAFKLFAKRRRVDAYITSGALVGITLAMLQLFCFWNRKPHVLIDCIWYISSSRMKYVLFSTVLKCISPMVTVFVVWAEHEVKDYSNAFGISRKKLKYVHFWHTLNNYTIEKNDKGYVFAGGNWDRDYKTVLKVARRLPDVSFCIGTTQAEQFAGLDIPENVVVKGYSHQGFRQAIASCHIMMVPMVKGVLHSGGQQTVLNAMYLEKPTIAYGKNWAQDLIEDNVNGFIVDYQNVEDVESIIRRLYDNSAEYQKISIEAGKEASLWPPSRSLEIVYRMAVGVSQNENLLENSLSG